MLYSYDPGAGGGEVLLKVFESHRHMEDDSQPQLTDVSTHLANMQVTNAGDSGQQMAPHASCSEPPDSECKLEARLQAVVADVSSHTAKESLLSLLRSVRVEDNSSCQPLYISRRPGQPAADLCTVRIVPYVLQIIN